MKLVQWIENAGGSAKMVCSSFYNFAQLQDMPWTGEPCFYVAMIREHICLPRLVKNGFISTQAQEALMIFDVSKMQ